MKKLLLSAIAIAGLFWSLLCSTTFAQNLNIYGNTATTTTTPTDGTTLTGFVSQTDTSQIYKGFVLVNAHPIEEMKDLQDFISKNMSNDVKDIIKKNQIEGEVFVQVIVGRDGIIQNIWILRRLDPIVEKEVLRLVKLIKWTPAYIRESAVKTSNIISFTL